MSTETAAALAGLRAVRRRSQDYLETLRAIDPAARRAEEDGNRYPRLTLRLGLAYHQAVIDECTEFERESPAPR